MVVGIYYWHSYVTANGSDHEQSESAWNLDIDTVGQITGVIRNVDAYHCHLTGRQRGVGDIAVGPFFCRSLPGNKPAKGNDDHNVMG